MGKNTYCFDESIAPLTEDEKKIMKEYKKLCNKVDKIYERTDKLTKLHKKTEKEKKKRQYLEEEKKRRILEKELEKKKIILQKQELVEKTIHFTNNYIQFKESFYKLFYELKLLKSNFQNPKDKVNQIRDLRKTFLDKCIHPESFKTIGYYSYETHDGGGYGGYSTYETRKRNACILCSQQDDDASVFRANINFTFSKNTDFDTLDNIQTLYKDFEHVLKI